MEGLVSNENSSLLKTYLDNGYSYIIDSISSDGGEKFILMNLSTSDMTITPPMKSDDITKLYSINNKKNDLVNAIKAQRIKTGDKYRHVYEGNLLHGQDEFFLSLDECLVQECIPGVDRKLHPLEDIFKGKNVRNCLPLTSIFSSYSTQTQHLSYVILLEQLMGIEIPDRAKAIRMLMLELSRILDHLRYILNLSRQIELNSLFSQVRETYQVTKQLLNQFLPSRSNIHMGVMGGCLEDLSINWIATTVEGLKNIESDCNLILNNYTKSSIFVEPLKCGEVSLAKALEMGASGTLLRASGANFDLRKKRPYYFYSDLEFEVPIGNEGTCYDRFLVRVEEIKQSINIMNQIFDNLPTGETLAPEAIDLYRPQSAENKATAAHKFLTAANSKPKKLSDAFYLEATEGVSGFYINCSSDGLVENIGFRNPKIHNLFAFLESIKGTDVALFDLIYTSFGIESYSFGDRR